MIKRCKLCESHEILVNAKAGQSYIECRSCSYKTGRFVSVGSALQEWNEPLEECNCPFCGSSYLKVFHKHGLGTTIECQDCKCRGPVISKFDTVEVWDKWNRRSE